MTTNMDDEHFRKVLVERGYRSPTIRKLRDGSWMASIRSPEEPLRETHTGLDLFGPRVRYVYKDTLSVLISPGQLSGVNDEPAGWIKRIPVPRYIGIKKLPKRGYEMRIFIGSEEVARHMEDCEIFLDDKDGHGMARFMARIRELGYKHSKVLPLCESVQARNWNHIYLRVHPQKKKST